LCGGIANQKPNPSPPVLGGLAVWRITTIKTNKKQYMSTKVNQKKTYIKKTKKIQNKHHQNKMMNKHK